VPVVAERTRQQRRTQRRFARRQWARRWLTWRYVAGALAVVLAVGFLGYAVYFSPWLRVEGVEVLGESQLAEETIVQTANVPTGDALAVVDLDAIAVRVRSLAEVEQVQVTRQWPREVRIEVRERSAVAVVARGDRFTQLDEKGVTFGTLDEAPEGLPQVRTGPGADTAALTEAAAVVSALPAEVSAIVDHVEVLTVDRILLHLQRDRLVRWGSADASDEKADVLLALLAAEEDGETEPAQEYDVSVPSRPTTRQ
jgi:cell division protein FtsQ